MVVCRNPSRFWNTQTGLSGTTVKITLVTFFPHSDATSTYFCQKHRPQDHRDTQNIHHVKVEIHAWHSILFVLNTVEFIHFKTDLILHLFYFMILNFTVLILQDSTVTCIWCVLCRYRAFGLCGRLPGPLHKLRNLWYWGLLHPIWRLIHGCSQQVPKKER